MGSSGNLVPEGEDVISLAHDFDGCSLSAHKSSRFRPTTSALLSTIQTDGILYFIAILSTNVIWLILCLDARPALKFLNAQPSMIITSIMINRLMLSLRKVSDRTSLRRVTEHWSDWEWATLEQWNF
ncbi:hypothetical protein D9757_007091 [Collybiopsis confluens]|uniref:Uncharacterized protein n=1 Tax=Collybiopsis confluens TaxID=2823264 RepID=A0A8H5HCJ1_9AGAR|nr:hypothetical protein D9757_007091 [Collybiopsis confluens]